MRDLAEEKPSALLCFERDPSGCHRTLLLRRAAPDVERRRPVRLDRGGFLGLGRGDDQRLDVGDRVAGHFLGDFAHHAARGFLVELLAQFAERLGRGDDRQRVEIMGEGALVDFLGRGLGPAIFLKLVEVGFLIGRAAIADRRLGRRPGPSVFISPSLASCRSSCASVRRSIWLTSPWLRKNRVLRPSVTRTRALLASGIGVSFT